MNEYQLPNHWFGQCFGCAPNNGEGLHLEFWMMDGACHTHYKVPAHMCGFDGLVHGGIVALMMDEVSQWTLIGTLGKIGLTRDLKVSYLKPVPVETELVVEGRVADQDENNVKIHLSAMGKDGEVLVTGESNYALGDVSKIAEITGVDEKQLADFLAKYPVE